jgi:hypothetical protein
MILLKSGKNTDMRYIIFLFFTVAVISSACKKDNENNNATSRILKYEVSGSYSGGLIASYTTASGGTANETITSLPWSKEITYAANVSAAIIAVTGNGGLVGQQVVVIVKTGGSQVSSTTATADNSGSFSQPAPVVTF